jgi:hypothetical protein
MKFEQLIKHIISLYLDINKLVLFLTYKLIFILFVVKLYEMDG